MSGRIDYCATSSELADGVARVMLSNPAKRNAIDIAMWRELRAVLRAAAGACPRARRRAPWSCCGEGGQFASGGDIAEFAGFRFDEARLHDFHEHVVAPALRRDAGLRHPAARADRGRVHRRRARDRGVLRHPHRGATAPLRCADREARLSDGAGRTAAAEPRRARAGAARDAARGAAARCVDARCSAASCTRVVARQPSWRKPRCSAQRRSPRCRRRPRASTSARCARSPRGGPSARRAPRTLRLRRQPPSTAKASRAFLEKRRAALRSRLRPRHEHQRQPVRRPARRLPGRPRRDRDRERSTAWSGFYTWRDLDRAHGDDRQPAGVARTARRRRVAVQTEKSVEALMLYLAVLRAGYVYLPLNTAYQAAEIEYFIGNAEPAWWSVRAQALRLGVARSPSRPARARVHARRRPQRHAARARRAACSDRARAGAMRRPTISPRSSTPSGTTGRSKGAMLTHGNLLSNALMLKRYWGWQAQRRRADPRAADLPRARPLRRVARRAAQRQQDDLAREVRPARRRRAAARGDGVHGRADALRAPARRAPRSRARPAATCGSSSPARRRC